MIAILSCLTITEDRFLVASEVYSDGQSVLAGAKAVLDTAAANIDVKGLEDRIKGFAESSKVFMAALDAVAQVHPFIQSKYEHT